MQDMRQPEHGTKNKNGQTAFHVTMLHWFRRGEQDQTIRSLGEYFLPFFLAAIEACWVNGVLIGLASMGPLESTSALMPFWGPPLLLIAAAWLFRRALQQEGNIQAGQAEEEDSPKSSLAIPGLRLMFALVGLITLCLVWLHIYSSRYFLFDPGWFLAFGGDFLALNWQFYQALAIAAIAFYLCWRGMRLVQLHIDPGHVFRQIWAGLLVLIVAILLRARQASSGGNADDIVLLLLIPIFLYLSLSTHALARITFIRREHPFGLEGSITDQERATLGVITIVGLVLLVLTIIGGSFFSSAFFNSIQPIWQAITVVYNWLITVFSMIILIVLTPFFWLFNWWFSLHPPQLPKPNQPGSGGKYLPLAHPSNVFTPGIVLTSKILLPLLIFLILALLLRTALRKRKRVRVSLNDKSGDIHESVWSWSLFWGQFRAFWWAFLRRLFPQRATSAVQARQREEITAPPAARTIREIYRALLQKASTRGYARKRDETPHEFQQRLDTRIPQIEPHLGTLTEAYALVRYGGNEPNDTELAVIRQVWNELEQQWETSS